MSASSFSIACLLLVTASSLAGCAVNVEPVGDPEVSGDVPADLDEDLGEAKSEFAEATCATTAYANIVDGTLWYLDTTGYFHSETSGNYGQPDCTHAFVVDYSNGSSETVNIWAGYYNQPTTSGACNMAKVKVQTYRLISGSWVPYEEMKRHGAWRGGQCWFDVDSGSSQASLGTGPTRVVAQAYSTLCLLGSCSTTYQPIKLNAYVSM